MAFTEDDVHNALKKHGITSLNDLAKKISDESASKEKSGSIRPDYLWSGRNYTFYHPEPEPPIKK
jgi:hypothetical protein